MLTLTNILSLCAFLGIIFVFWVLMYGAHPHSGPVRVYLAGTISGNLNNGIISQDYREKISGLLKEVYPGIEVHDPRTGHENSLNYDDNQARQMFTECIRNATYGTDVMVAYLPEASMGTAVEIYEASRRGNYVIIITPLTNNWIVRLYGNRVFSSIEDFSACLFSGEFDSVIHSITNDFDGSRIWENQKNL